MERVKKKKKKKKKERKGVGLEEMGVRYAMCSAATLS
jgi:hypothetical protein